MSLRQGRHNQEYLQVIHRLLVPKHDHLHFAQSLQCFVSNLSYGLVMQKRQICGNRFGFTVSHCGTSRREPACRTSIVFLLVKCRSLGFEGVGSEGVGSEGVGSEGVGSEDVGSEGVGSEGVGSEGVGSEGVGSEGVGSEGVGSEGVGSEGVGSEGVPCLM
jgi:hypothetical protein